MNFLQKPLATISSPSTSALSTPRTKRSARAAETPTKSQKKSTPNKKRRLQLDSVSWEVQELMDHKYEDGDRYFRVHWKGYTSEDDTWEREENLQCPRILKSYLKKNNL